MLARDASEKIFQDWVIQIARMNGWDVFHEVPRSVAKGKHVSAGPGFPDLCLKHDDRGLIFAELKTEVGKLSERQVKWLQGLSKFAEVYVWRPRDINEIAARLGAPSPFSKEIEATVLKFRRRQ